MIRTERPAGVDVTDPPVSSRGQLAALAPQTDCIPFLSSPFSVGLPQRLVLFAILFAVEWIPVSHFVQTSRVYRGRGIVSPLLQLGVVFGCFFLALTYTTARNTFQQISSELKGSRIGWGFLPGHLAAFLGFLSLLFLPLWDNPASYLYRSVMAVMFSAAGVLAIALCLVAFVPAKAIVRLVRASGVTWLHALIVGLIAWSLLQSFPLWNAAVWEPQIDLAWKPATDLTFGLVTKFLHLFLSDVIANRATMTIGNPSFRVRILAGCAGFEGTALMLVFSVAWLWFMRREFRFPTLSS